MAACNIFDEDEVCMLTDKGCIYGLVLENSEYVSTDEEQNDPDPFCDCVRRGTVRVAWHPDGKESVVSECKLILADRSLMPGDCVRRLIQGEDSQRGYVQDMTVECCLQVMGTRKFIDGIPSKDLLQIREWSPEPGDVVLDSWVGRIDVVNVIVTLRFPDGAKCEIQDVDIFSFEDLNDKRGKHTEFVNRFYYPGQQLRGVMGDLRDVEWIHSTQLYNKTTANNKQRMNVIVVVEEVKTKDVEVHWSCCGFKNASSTEAPPSIVKTEDLTRMKKLDWFHHSSIQIGDKAYYIIKETDTILDQQPKHHSRQSVSNGGQVCSGLTNGFTDARNGSKASGGDVEVGESCLNGTETTTASTLSTTATTETNAIKDEDEKKASNSQSKIIMNIEEIENLDEYEEVDDDDESDQASATSGQSNASSSSLRRKKPAHRGPTLKTQLMKKVRGRKARQKMILPERDLKPGEKVPVEVCYTFSRVNVMWQDGSVELGIPSPDLFPIHHLDELEFFPGDYVLEAKDSGTSNVYGVVVSCNHAERTCLVKWMKAYDAGKSNRPEVMAPPSEVSVYDIKDHPYYKFRPGHPVIRVGGADATVVDSTNENSAEPVEAAGQVYQLDPQGFIMVKWPSSRVTCCYPQELFVVGDEMSDVSSEGSSSEEEDDDDDDDEEEEDNSDCSWETENEEEIDPDTLEPKSPLPKTLLEQSSRCGTYDERKDHLDYLIQRANSALSRLDAMVKSDDPNYPLDVLRLFHNCQSLDKFLKLSHFDDPDMNDLVSLIEAEVSRLKDEGQNNDTISLNDSSFLPLDSVSEDNQENIATTSLGQVTCSPSKQMDPSFEGNNNNNIVNNNSKKESYDFKSDPTGKTKLSSSKSATALLPSDKINSSGSGLTSHTSKLSKSMEFDSDGIKDVPIWMMLPSSRLNNPSQTSIEWNKSIKELCSRLIKLLQDRIGRMPKEVNKKWRKRILEATRNIPFCDDCHKDKGVQTDSSQVEETDALPGHSWFSVTAGPTEHKAVQTSATVEENCASGAVTSGEQDEASKEQKSDGDISKLDNSLSLDQQEDCSVEEFDPAARNTNGFQVVDEPATSHHYLTHTHLSSQKNFLMSLRRESKLLKTSLPDGIFVKEFEERMDLFSVMIVGPAKTPYEDGLFIFDVQLPNDYPSSPPRFHYVSYCTDRLNPNLYEDGKVCVSLLGTWSGKGNEMWTQESNLLQVLVSIQGLILVGEPYYNEAGYEKQRGTQQGIENSRMYNEMAIVKLVQAMTNMARKLPPVFTQEVKEHLLLNGPKMITRLRKWLELSDKVSLSDDSSIPAIVDFCPSEENSTREESTAVAASLDSQECDVASPNQQAEASSEHETTPSQQQEEERKENEEEMTVTNTTTTTFNTNSKETSQLQLCSTSSVSIAIDSNSYTFPDFPLLPASRGFCLSLKKHLELFQSALTVLEKKVQ